MTNNENKTAEEIYLEHVGKAVNARSVYYARAIQAMHHFALQQSQSALGEKDFIIKKKDEIIESQKQTFDSLLKKYEAKDKEIEGLKKECDKYEAQMLKDGSTIQSLKEEVEGLKLKVIYERALATKKDERIKELEEAWIKTLLAGVYVSDREYALKYINSLLSQSKEQKEEVKGSRAERRKVMQTITIEYGERFLLRARHLNDYAETEVEVGEIQIPSEKGSLQKITRLHCLRF